jgi:hypothetical protein
MGATRAKGSPSLISAGGSGNPIIHLAQPSGTFGVIAGPFEIRPFSAGTPEISVSIISGSCAAMRLDLFHLRKKDHLVGSLIQLDIGLDRVLANIFAVGEDWSGIGKKESENEWKKRWMELHHNLPFYKKPI